MADYDKFSLARRYFDLREYERAAHFLTSCCSSEAYFVRMYSLYLASEKKFSDNSTDIMGNAKSIIL